MDERNAHPATAFKNSVIFVGGLISLAYFDMLRSRKIPPKWQSYAGGVGLAGAVMLGMWAEHVRERNSRRGEHPLSGV